MESMGLTQTDQFAVFKNKRVFITGHTGFKGSWLSVWLNKLGAEVAGFSLIPPYSPNLYNLLGDKHLALSHISDIRNFTSLQKSIEDFQPDFIFHLAAQPLVRYSYDHPLETYETNVIGTANLLESIKYVKKPCITLIITTDKVYQNNEWIFPYREVDQLGGYDPYSSSKACAELVVSSYRNSFFHPSKIDFHQQRIFSVRAGNVIGGGDWSLDRLLPDVARQLQNGNEIIIRNPNATRPWQHVLEPLSGYLSLAEIANNEPEKFNEGAWNFGPLPVDNLKVVEIVKMALQSWGSGKLTINENVAAPHEAGMLSLDISKALTTLNWKPKMDASQAVDLTIAWYKKYYKGADPLQLMQQDIDAYSFMK